MKAQQLFSQLQTVLLNNKFISLQRRNNSKKAKFSFTYSKELVRMSQKYSNQQIKKFSQLEEAKVFQYLN